MRPKVSIIVPVYNTEKYLEACLKSIVAQTLTSIEIICIDDGSTDASPRILDEYALRDNRILVHHNANHGYGYSINFGISCARWDYVGIVESDDLVLENMFETLYARALRYANTEIVKSNFFYYWSDGNRRELCEVIPQDSLNCIFSPRDKVSIFFSMPCIWAAIYKRDFLLSKKIRCLETPGASYQDTSFNFKALAMAERVATLDEAFLLYRQDNEASSVKSSGKIYCVCEEYAEIERFAHFQDLPYRIIKLVQRMKWGCYLWNFNRLRFPTNYKFATALSREFSRACKLGLIDSEYFGKKDIKKLYKYIRFPFLVSLSKLFKNR